VPFQDWRNGSDYERLLIGRRSSTRVCRSP